MELLTLNTSALITALAMGALFILFGGWTGLELGLVMLYFLMLSAIVTYIGYTYKISRRLTQKERSVWNVLANGLGPLMFALLFFYSLDKGSASLAIASFFGFFGSVASVTADKFSSELGVLDGTPRMIFTMKKVKKGTSGGITWLGIAVGAAAAFLIALAVIPVELFSVNLMFYGAGITLALLIVTVSGIFGTLIDSALGYFEEKKKGNKYTSNFLCSIIGGLIAMGLAAAIFAVL